MTPEEPTTTPTAPSRRTLIVSLVGFLAIAGIAVAIYEYWPRRLPPTDSSTIDLVKFVTTDQFADLTEKQKELYTEEMLRRGFGELTIAAIQSGLPREQLDRGFNNAMVPGMEIRWGRHLDVWLKLDAKGKADYVKKVVASMPPRPANFSPHNGRNRGMSPQQQKNFIESMAPDRRAQMAEFMTQIRAAHGDGGK